MRSLILFVLFFIIVSCGKSHNFEFNQLPGLVVGISGYNVGDDSFNVALVSTDSVLCPESDINQFKIELYVDDVLEVEFELKNELWVKSDVGTNLYGTFVDFNGENISFKTGLDVSIASFEVRALKTYNDRSCAQLIADRKITVNNAIVFAADWSRTGEVSPSNQSFSVMPVPGGSPITIPLVQKNAFYNINGNEVTTSTASITQVVPTDQDISIGWRASTTDKTESFDFVFQPIVGDLHPKLRDIELASDGLWHFQSGGGFEQINLAPGINIAHTTPFCVNYTVSYAVPVAGNLLGVTMTSVENNVYSSDSKLQYTSTTTLNNPGVTSGFSAPICATVDGTAIVKTLITYSNGVKVKREFAANFFDL